MSRSDQFNAAIAETRIAIESAMATAEVMTNSEIGNSLILGQMLVFLHDAIQGLARIEEPVRAPEGHTIFPDRVAAQQAIDALPQHITTAYRLAPYGDGRCSIEIFKLMGRV